MRDSILKLSVNLSFPRSSFLLLLLPSFSFSFFFPLFREGLQAGVIRFACRFRGSSSNWTRVRGTPFKNVRVRLGDLDGSADDV